MMEVSEKAFRKAIKEAFEAGVDSGKAEERRAIIAELEELECDCKARKMPGMYFFALRNIVARVRRG